MDVGFDELVSYLSRTGWQRTLSGPKAELWHPGDDEENTVLVPKNPEAKDFSKTFAILTRELAKQEQRPPAEIALEISREFLDVTDLRAEDDDITEGTISLAAGIGLFNSAHRMMISAAAATINRQPYYGNAVPKAAYKHARRMRLGQTRPGSYIVPIISRAKFGVLVNDASDEPRLEVRADDTYFERRMLATLSQALETLAEMVVNRDRSPTRDEMRSAIDDGVSSELCGAILDVVGNGGVDLFDVKFNWAPTSPAPASVASQVFFTGESATLLKGVESELKEADAPAERVLYGIIRRLSLKRNEVSGQVALETVLDGKSRIVTFELPLEVYRRAARYHGERRPVIVRGILDATPGRRATMNVSAFDVDRSVATFDDLES